MFIGERISTRERIFSGTIGPVVVCGAAYFLSEFLSNVNSDPFYKIGIACDVAAIVLATRDISSAVLGRHVHIFTPAYNGLKSTYRELKSIATKSYNGLIPIVNRLREDKPEMNNQNYAAVYGGHRSILFV